MIYEQLTFLDKLQVEEQAIWLKYYDLKEKQDNLRRGLFSRHDQVKKEVSILQQEVEILKSLVQSLMSNEKIVQLNNEEKNAAIN